MGQKHRERRAAFKLIIGAGLKRGGLDHVKPSIALKLLRGGVARTKPKWKLQVENLGYKENELGELVSTIQKLTENEIIDRLCKRATYELHKIEDAHVFAILDEAAQGCPP